MQTTKESLMALCANISVCSTREDAWDSINAVVLGMTDRMRSVVQQPCPEIKNYNDVVRWCFENTISLSTELLDDFSRVFDYWESYGQWVRYGYLDRWPVTWDADDFVRRAEAILSFLFSKELLSKVSEQSYYQVDFDEVSRLHKTAHKLFCAPSDYVFQFSNPRVKSIHRISQLWQQALCEPKDNWEQQARKFLKPTEEFKKYTMEFAANHYAMMFTVCMGFGEDGKYSTHLQPRRCKEKQNLHKLSSNQLDLFNTRESFRHTALYLAFLDMPVGSVIEDFPDHVVLAMYLLCKKVDKEYGKQMKQTVLDFIRPFFITDTGKTSGSNVASALSLSNIIASIRPPVRERYSDKPYLDGITFDYVSVEVVFRVTSLKQVIPVLKKNRRELKQLILDRVRTAFYFRDKPLLVDLLYISELQVYGGGRGLIAMLEFKPGVEKVLEGTDSGVCKMKLE